MSARILLLIHFQLEMLHEILFRFIVRITKARLAYLWRGLVPTGVPYSVIVMTSSSAMFIGHI